MRASQDFRFHQTIAHLGDGIDARDFFSLFKKDNLAASIFSNKD